MRPSSLVRLARYVVTAAAIAALLAGCKSQSQSGLASENIPRLQSELRDLGELHLLRLAQATSDIEQSTTSIEARQFVASFRLRTADATITNITALNPLVGLIDFAVMISLQRAVLEEFAPEVLGEKAQMLVNVYMQTGQDVATLLARELSPQQIEELDTEIQEWRRENPNQRLVSHVRLRDLADYRELAAAQETRGPRSLFTLLYLDPFANLDPATRQIQETRVFAERTLYLARRTLLMSNWFADLLYMDLVSAPEVRTLLDEIQRASQAAERASHVAADGPAWLGAEREATLAQAEQIIARQRGEVIDQVQAAVATEREAIFRQLDDSQGPMRQSLAELRETFTSADALSASLKGLVLQAEDFGRTFRLDEPSEPGAKGFDAAEFQRMSQETAAAARDLTRLVESVGQLSTSPAVGDTAKRAEQAATRLANAILYRAVILIAAFGIALFLALTGSRLMTDRLRRRRLSRSSA
jgi:hypothetical protein